MENWFVNQILLSLIILLPPFLLFLRRHKSASHHRRPPGPPGWPVLGNVFDLGDMPHKNLAGMKRTYGPVLWLRIGSINTMVVQSSAAAAEFFMNQDMNFLDRSVTDAVKSHDYHKSSLAMAPYGTYWRVMKRMLTIDMMANKRLNETMSLRRKSVDDLIYWIHKEITNAGKDTQGIEVSQFVFLASFNMVGNLVFSRDLVDPESADGMEFFTAMVNFLEWTTHPNIVDLFPWLRWLDPQGIRRKAEKEMGKTLQVVSKYVKECVKERQQSGEKKKDYLELLLEFEGDGKDELLKLSDHDVNAIIMISPPSLKKKKISGLKYPYIQENRKIIFHPSPPISTIHHRSPCRSCSTSSGLHNPLTSSSNLLHHVSTTHLPGNDDKNNRNETDRGGGDDLVPSASVVAVIICKVSTSPVEFFQRLEKAGRDTGLVLPSADFQRLCIEQLNLFRGIVHPDALLSEAFIAGTDTTSSVIEWAMVELLNNPITLSKLKEELNHVVGNDRLVEETDFDNLKHLQSVIKETLRLHPTIPLLVPRLATQDTKFMGYDIPKDTQVFVNAFAIGRDPQNWDEPESFKPERFLDSSIDFKGQHFDLIPFGAGRRICPGIPLVHRMLILVLGSLVHEFDWHIHDSEAYKVRDTREKMGLAVRKAEPLIAIPRLKSVFVD